MASSSSAFRYRIRGRVQRVGFRDFTCRVARELGVTGWVRNHPDGSVEGEVEGDEESLESFREHLHRGPPLARVDSLEERPIPCDPERTTFDFVTERPS